MIAVENDSNKSRKFFCRGVMSLILRTEITYDDDTRIATAKAYTRTHAHTHNPALREMSKQKKRREYTRKEWEQQSRQIER